MVCLVVGLIGFGKFQLVHSIFLVRLSWSSLSSYTDSSYIVDVSEDLPWNAQPDRHSWRSGSGIGNPGNMALCF